MKRTFEDELNEIRRRSGLKEQTLTESMNFTAYRVEGKRQRFGFPDKWTQEEIYHIPYHEIDHGRYINEPGYAEKVSGPNPDFRPELNLNMSNSNAMDVTRFLRDVLKMKVTDDPEGWIVPTKEFVWKVKAWMQKPIGEPTPEIEPTDSHDPDSPVDPRLGGGPLGDLSAKAKWERKRQGNVVDLKKSPTGARVISGGRKEGYVEEQLVKMLPIAEEALEMGISHVGLG